MAEEKKNVCDKCLFNHACEALEPENCTIPCLRKEDPLFKVFLMGYNKGYDDGYDDCQYECEEEYESDEYGSYKLAIPEEVEEEGE